MVNCTVAFVKRKYLKISHLNGSIAEIHGWEDALNKGYVAIKPPKLPHQTTARGVDYAAFDQKAGDIVLSDAKYRGPGGKYPTTIPQSQVDAWTEEIKAYIEAMPDSQCKADMLDALKNGRIRPEIFRWPK